jgi:hypothetical protein
MQTTPEMYLYEYAIIRVVPRVEREEFINAGVILCSPKQQFLKCKIHLHTSKLISLDPKADSSSIEAHLNAFEHICIGGKKGGPIAQNTQPARFRWLTAMRSSVIQTSRPHPGLTKDLDKLLEHLFEEYVV